MRLIAPLNRRPNVHVGVDSTARSLSQAVENLSRKDGHMGLYATPDMSFVDILSKAGVGGTASRGIRVVFGEGTWFFNAAGFSTSRDKIHLISLSPGRTVFARTQTATGPLLTFSGSECIVSGIRFDDAAGTEPAVKVTGSKFRLSDCWFEDCWRALQADGSSYLTTDGNHVEASRDTTYSVFVTGTATDCRVDSWTVESSPTTEIYMGDSVTRSIISGNRTSGGVISYTGGGSGNVASANTGTVTAR